MKKDRPRIAMLGVGQIGGGILGQGVPVFFEMVKRISKEFDVAFYSLMPVRIESTPPGLTVYSVSSKRISLYVRYCLLLARLIYHHIKNPFDIIFSVSAFPAGRMAVILGWILRRPVVVLLLADEMVAMPEIEYGELLDAHRRRINGWVCRTATELIVLSDYQKKTVLNNLGVPRTILVMPLGIDVGKFPYRTHEITSPIQFVHVAYYHRVKDQVTLFRAFAQVSQKINCELTVIGGGFDRHEVRELLNELSIADKVHFPGVMMNDRLSEVFSRMHILLHTSRYETQCVVAMEAMASGVVVCGTSVGFLADHGDGLAVVVPPADATALARAVLDLLRDPDRYKFLQLSGRKFIEEHSADQTSNTYQALFSHLVYSSRHEKL